MTALNYHRVQFPKVTYTMPGDTPYLHRHRHPGPDVADIAGIDAALDDKLRVDRNDFHKHRAGRNHAADGEYLQTLDDAIDRGVDFEVGDAAAQSLDRLR